MKRVLITNGWPIVYHPHAETISAMIEGFEKLATPFGDCILTGCVIGADTGGGNYPISEGIVILNGEILRMPAATIGDGMMGSSRVVFKSTTTISPYPVAHADGEIKPMVVEDIAQIKNALAVGEGEIAYADLPRVDDKLRSLFASGWTTVVPTADFDFVGIATEQKLMYKVINGEVIFRGRIRKTGTFGEGGTLKIFELDEQNAPLLQSILPQIQNHTGAAFRVEATGEVFIDHDAVGATIYNIHDFRYRID